MGCTVSNSTTEGRIFILGEEPFRLSPQLSHVFVLFWSKGEEKMVETELKNVLANRAAVLRNRERLVAVEAKREQERRKLEQVLEKRDVQYLQKTWNRLEQHDIRIGLSERQVRQARKAEVEAAALASRTATRPRQASPCGVSPVRCAVADNCQVRCDDRPCVESSQVGGNNGEGSRPTSAISSAAYSRLLGKTRGVIVATNKRAHKSLTVRESPRPDEASLYTMRNTMVSVAWK